MVVRTVSAKPEPICFIAEDMPAIPTRNKYSAVTTPVVFSMISKFLLCKTVKEKFARM